MNGYIEIYRKGFEEGLYLAYQDFLDNKKRIFKNIDDNILKTKIYDLGYITGYDMFYNIIKNHL